MRARARVVVPEVVVPVTALVYLALPGWPLPVRLGAAAASKGLARRSQRRAERRTRALLQQMETELLEARKDGHRP